MQNKELLKELIYLFPFTADAALMIHVLSNNGYTVAGICDSNPALQGRTYAGCPIVPKVSGEDETVIICGYKQYRLAGLFKKSVLIEQVLTANDIPSALEKVKWDEFDALAPKQTYRFHRLPQEIRQVLPPDGADLKLNALDIVLTEWCNLKCKCCEVLVQHFGGDIKPRHIPLEQLIRETDEIFKKFGFVRDIHVLGVEPFIYPQLAEYMRYLKKHRGKIGSLYVITNGTVIPRQDVIDAIKESDAFVMISDYDELSRNKDGVVQAVKDNGVGVQVTDYPWVYENQLVYDGDKTYQQKFNDCYERKHIYTIRDGKAYYCHFLASGETLKAIPYRKGNGISIYASSGQEILDYLTSETAPPGCEYCSGHDLNSPKIPKAEQAGAPIPYKSFEETYE